MGSRIGRVPWNKGIACSEETKRRMRAALKGRVPWNKGKHGVQVPTNLGKHLSEETKKKISNTLKGNIPWNKGLPPELQSNWGKHLSEETREKIRIANTGKPGWDKGGHRPEEWKRKISETHKGKNNPMYGREVSAETRRKRSISMMGKPAWNKGKKLPEWIRRKISEAQKQENGSNWRGGITKENKLIRASLDYKLWKEAVFERDDWTCQICGKRGGDLHAHHTLPFSKYPQFRFAIDKGITLCTKCHKEVHKKK